MKFYNCKGNGNYLDKIEKYELTAIFHKNNKNFYYVQFFKNGLRHNSKNAALIYCDGYKYFYFYGENYGYEDNFTKQYWRRFVKLQAFL